MSQTEEGKLWSKFRVNFPKSDVRLDRIETKGEEGHPDVYGIWKHNSTNFWVELKYIDCDHPKDSLKIPYRPSQPLWHMEEARYGGRVFTLVSFAHKQYWLIQASPTALWIDQVKSRFGEMKKDIVRPVVFQMGEWEQIYDQIKLRCPPHW